MPIGVYKRTQFHRDVASKCQQKRWSNSRQAWLRSLTDDERRVMREVSELVRRIKISVFNRGRSAPWTSKRLREDWANPEKRAKKIVSLQQPRSEETKEKIAVGVAKYASTFTTKRTPIELALRRLLIEASYNIREQAWFGRNVVDVYVEELNIAFEADGAYWHQDKVAEAERDSRLITQGLFAVVHLTENDLQPWSEVKLKCPKQLNPIQ